jgi:hypothetical protein
VEGSEVGRRRASLERERRALMAAAVAMAGEEGLAENGDDRKTLPSV